MDGENNITVASGVTYDVLTKDGLEYYDYKMKKYIDECYTLSEEFNPIPKSVLSGSTWGALTENDIDLLIKE